MPPAIARALIVCTFSAASLASDASAAPVTVHEGVLPNGVRVCYLHCPGAKGVSIFTFLPMGLAADDAGRTQWSHLIEHLVIRTTVEGQLKNVNAETLPDHMRLDYYGKPADWREGLAHHARWLEGLPFTEVSLRDEPGRANAEVDHTAKVMATHKFATAAWNQVYRHGRRHVAVKDDLTSAASDDLLAYRDGRLFVPGKTMVCLIGAEGPGPMLDAVGEALGGIEADAADVAPALPVEKLHPGSHEATWDVDARHLLITWPTPPPAEDPAAHAALAVAGRLLWLYVAQDQAVAGHLGNVVAANDLRTPEGVHLFVSGAVRADGDPAKARQAIGVHIARLRETPAPAVNFQLLKLQFLAELEPSDPTAIPAAPFGRVTVELVEAQAALTWATTAYRLGAARDAYKQALSELTAERVRAAAAKWLADDRMTVVELRPPD